MLLGNYSVLQKSPMKYSAGSTASDEGQLRSNFNKSGNNRNRFYVDQATTALRKYAVPTGYYPNATWIIPQVAGEIGSGQVLGAGSNTGNLAGGLNAASSLTGAGDLTSAVAQLVISMVANLAGTGTVSSADMKAFLNAVANLSGGGTVTGAAIAALAWAQAALAGGGTISNATPYATGTLAATITGYSALTPEGIRDSVWNAVLTNYPISGSAGNTLALAGSGGVDYNALAVAVWANATRTLTSGSPTEAQIAAAVWAEIIESGYSATEMLRLMAAVLDGKLSGAGTGTEVFRDLADTKNRIVATVDSVGNRTAITRDAT